MLFWLRSAQSSSKQGLKTWTWFRPVRLLPKSVTKPDEALIEEALIEAERSRRHFGTAQRMEMSRSAEDKAFVVQAVQAHIHHSKTYWDRCEQTEKREFVRILLAPYTASQEFVDTIIREAT